MTYGTAIGLVTKDRDRTSEGSIGLKVAVCGSFRKDREGLERTVTRLKSIGCMVLSPLDTNFVLVRDGFALAEHELDQEALDIERRHLSAMQEADFVWLHAPTGYVGLSASLEIGFAAGQGLPMFCDSDLDDGTLRNFVTKVSDVSAAVEAVSSERVAAASEGLTALQKYYGRAAERRGWASETPAECLRLLRLEVEELDEALAGLEPEHGPVASNSHVAEEVADVQLYLVHLANALELELAAAVRTKERRNAERFGNAARAVV